MMAEIKAPVVATLTGVQSLDPVNKPEPSPATFAYVAGPKCKDEGVVTMTSTSKRGIGTGTAKLTVKTPMMMMCPAGETWNADTCMCECMPKSCPNGTWDPATCQCVACNKTCAAGQTLNLATCQCETACQIDPIIGAPDGCVWVGSISITSESSGEIDDPAYATHTSWSFSYNASLALTDPSPTDWNLTGSVSGSYHEVDTFFVCPSTRTIDSRLSEDQASFSFIAITPGFLVFSVTMRPDDAVFTGTEIISDPCQGSSSTSEPTGLLGAIDGFPMPSGPFSGSTFSGSDPDALPNFIGMPDGSTARFNLTWNLRLVRQ